MYRRQEPQYKKIEFYMYKNLSLNMVIDDLNFYYLILLPCVAFILES